MLGYIEAGKKSGATLLCGGNRIEREGFFIEPTLFTDVDHSMSIVCEEIFGPCGVIQKFEDDDEVVRLANDSEYGLAAAVFSTNIKRALKVAHKFQAGTVTVNMANMLHFQSAFGGFKASGMGRELGEEALS